VEVISGRDVQVWRKKVDGMMMMKGLTKCIMGVQIDTIDNIDSNFLLYSFFFFMYKSLSLSVGIDSVFSLTFSFLLYFLFFNFFVF
jgi:hypothetical protein